MEKTTWVINISDMATYYIKSESLEDAKDLAVEWFQEREPFIETSTTDNEPDYEI